MGDGEPRLLATSFSAPETAVLLSLLQSYEIPACALDGHTRTVPTMMLALGGNRIYVPEADYDDARRILADSMPQETLAKPMVSDGPGNVLVTLAMTFLFGFVPPPRVALEVEE
jgi:hypothetical protein